MKSSDFERLGDWQRKQRYGFEDALDDKLSRNQRNPQKNSVISTDTSRINKRKSFKIYCKETKQFVIKYFLNIRGYSEDIDSNNENFVYFSNGKSILEINTNYDCICNGFKFNEYFENLELISKGSFPASNSGIHSYIDRRYFKREGYKGSEYFRQAFLFEDKLATISLILKKIDDVKGWCCVYPKFSMYIELSYFDVNNNESLKGLNINAKLDIISVTNSFLARQSIPNYKEIIPIFDNVCGSINHSDSSFFSDNGYLYQCQIEKGLSKAVKKVEHYLGTSLEKKEKLGIVKKLILSKNK